MTIAKVSRTKLRTSFVNRMLRLSRESVTAGNIGRSNAVECDAFKCSQNPQTALFQISRCMRSDRMILMIRDLPDGDNSKNQILVRLKRFNSCV